ncbi:MAG: hypothetical protein HYY85_18840 [Deltaproteobacteria bacterium]|nr:hypothetical protein [Deltaproteobacteria bacterium]
MDRTAFEIAQKADAPAAVFGNFVQNKSFVLSVDNLGQGGGGRFFSLDGEAGLKVEARYKAHAGVFEITYPLYGGDPLVSTGSALVARNLSAGAAGIFEIKHGSNGSTALTATTDGRGSAGEFKIPNAENWATALYVETYGRGGAGSFHASNGDSYSPALFATTWGNGSAVYANTWGTGWAGYFEGNGSTSKGVYISAPSGQPGLQVAGGTKNAVVRTSGGARVLYSEETTEVWFSDYGFGRLRDGRAHVALDPLFGETVSLAEPYHVFVQAYGDAQLYVGSRTPRGFEVRARQGELDVEFSYRIVAKRLGYEKARLERAPWADDDPNLYPKKGGDRVAVQGSAR